MIIITQSRSADKDEGDVWMLAAISANDMTLSGARRTIRNVATAEVVDTLPSAADSQNIADAERWDRRTVGRHQ